MTNIQEHKRTYRYHIFSINLQTRPCIRRSMQQMNPSNHKVRSGINGGLSECLFGRDSTPREAWRWRWRCTNNNYRHLGRRKNPFPDVFWFLLGQAGSTSTHYDHYKFQREFLPLKEKSLRLPVWMRRKTNENLWHQYKHKHVCGVVSKSRLLFCASLSLQVKYLSANYYERRE